MQSGWVKIVFTVIILVIQVNVFYGQTGPGGVGTSSNNILWLRADEQSYNNAGTTLATDGQTVQEWHDQSGNNTDVDQATGDDKPSWDEVSSNFNGKSCITFDGSDDYFSFSSFSNSASDYTMFLVLNTSSTSQEKIFDAQTGRLIIGHHGGLSIGAFYDGSLHGTGIAVSGTQMIGWDLDNAGASVYEDGTQTQTSMSYTQKAIGGSITLGSTYSGANEHFTGDIAEFIIYNSTLNNAERIIIENYLGNKYGITIANDYFSYQAVHDEDLAGIGRESSVSHQQTEASSANLLRMKTPSGLENNEYIMWAHEGGNIASWTNTDVQVYGGIERVAREWRVDKTGDAGTVTIQVDIDDLPIPNSGYADYVLMIDADGDFTSGSTILGLELESGTIYETTTVTLAAGDYIAIGIVQNCSKQTGNYSTTTTWIGSDVPAVSESVVIVGGHTVTLTAAADNDGIYIESGATFDVSASNYDLNISGHLVNGGTFTERSGEVIFDGSGAQSIEGAIDFYDLTIDNSANTVTNTDGIDTIANILLLTDGTYATGGNVVLKSTASNTACIAQVGEGVLSGNVTWQRYMDLGSLDGGWRELTSPIVGSTLAEWQDDYPTCGFINASSTSCGGFISVYYNDESDDTGESITAWAAATNSTNSVDAYGVSIYLASDKAIIDVVGVPNTGEQVFNGASTPSISYNNNDADQDQNGWNFIGNPFPSSINWNDITSGNKVNIDNTIYMYNTTAGNYGIYVGDASSGTNNVDSIIPSGHAFWIHATASNPVLTIPERAKTTRENVFVKSSFFPKTAVKMSIKSEINNFSDEVLIMFDGEGKETYDPKKEALKMYSFQAGAPGIMVIKDNLEMSTASLPDNYDNYTIPLKAVVDISGVYTIGVELMYKIPETGNVFLFDTEQGIMTDLEANDGYTTWIDKSSTNARFELQFSTEPLNMKAEYSDGAVSVYPNPINESTRINFNNESANQVNFSVYSITGQLVDQLNDVNPDFSYSGSNLSSGIYTYELQSANRLIAKGKLVVND
ncbi:MAG: T9SS type A sorting domain-containing protein [Flavobacteriales bacterium]|nr:T9SS type A sorting domain-containing protein [Flavobacteriales bacterium]